MDEIKKVKVIDSDTVINIPISGYFYKRLQQLSNSMIKDKSSEDLKSAYTQIKEQNFIDDFSYNLETIFILCGTFEKMANDEGKIRETDIENVVN